MREIGAIYPFSVFLCPVIQYIGLKNFDDRQIAHLICVRLKHLLYDLFRVFLGHLPVVFLLEKAQNTP